MNLEVPIGPLDQLDHSELDIPVALEDCEVEGLSLRAIAERMNDEGRRTARGAEFKLATVQRHL